MITKLLYYTILLPISYLPYSILYYISDFLFIVIYQLLGYRKAVVFSNLSNSFPDKTTAELKEIMADFYRHLCDLIVESVKGFTISKKQLKKRLVVLNPEFTNKYAKEGKDVIFVGGHYNNWEIYAQGFAMYSTHKCIGIYKPLSNVFFNTKMSKSRSKFGTHLVPMRQTKKIFSEQGKPKALVFGSDQNPANPKRAYWMQFLNQDTGVLFGVEKYAKEYDWPVIYISINKVKRGHYTVEYSLITDNPTTEPYGKITEDYTKVLEQQIINEPKYWLWSHKRWKHKR